MVFQKQPLSGFAVPNGQQRKEEGDRESGCKQAGIPISLFNVVLWLLLLFLISSDK